MKKLVFTLSLFLILTILHAQKVSTFSKVPSNAGIAVQKNGDVFVANEDNVLYKVDKNGRSEVLVSNSPLISRAIMITFSPFSGDTLYVTNAPLDQLGWVVKVAPDGSCKKFTDGLALPTGMAFDQEGIMYVADHRNQIWRVKRDGSKEVMINSKKLNRPHGLAWADGFLYVASAHNGHIYKIATEKSSQPEVQHFAYIDGLKEPWACGHMVYSDGGLYITNGDDRIHRIDMDGKSKVLAGSGKKGYKNGRANKAQFTAPNGIGAGMDGNSLYVTEYKQNKIRLIQGLDGTKRTN